MKRLFAVLFTIITFPLFANDGAYMSSGGVIYPVKETKISLEKEFLSFTVRDKIAQVDIRFEFNNPEKIERKLLVGFQAPAPSGDVPEETCNKNQISNFRILKDGVLLPYQLKTAECEDCELKNPGELYWGQHDGGVFVYLFEVVFQPGINVIHHSYSFPASSDVIVDQMYNYILKTGAKWANEKIKELTVQLDMGSNQYFYVRDIFGKNAVWSLVGTGKIVDKHSGCAYITPCRKVRMLSGKLQIAARDFRPTENIDFGILHANMFADYSDYNDETIRIYAALRDMKLNSVDDESYTEKELKIIRNTVYARYGYVFESKELQDYFSHLDWYISDPNLMLEQILLTKNEQMLIDEVTKKEKRMKD